MQNVKKSLSIKILASFTLLFLLFNLICNFIERKDKIYAYADSTYTSATFNSSNLILTRLGYTSSASEFDFKDLKDDWLDTIYYNFSFKIDYDSSSDNVIFYVKGRFNYRNYLFDYTTGLDQDDTFSNVGNYNFNSSVATNIPARIRYRSSSMSSTSYYYSPILFNFEYFDSNTNSYIVPNSYFMLRPSLVINEIIFGNYTEIDRMNFATDSLYGTHLNSSFYNFVSLIDSVGFRYTFFIPLCSNSSENFENGPANYLTYREYYTKNAINLGDNSAYQQGYNEGYNNGAVDGNEQGYKEGYSAGEVIGYNNGFTAGVENGGNYTFASLLGAVVDVPVKTFTNLFNFELLGVNLAGFFSGLLTLAVILTIVRLIKGG